MLALAVARKRGGLIVALLVCLVAIADAAQAADKVTLRLDWSAVGYHAPFYVAQDRGYYKDANLDVEINEGKGSNTNVQLVARGQDTFVFADAAAAAKGASIGLPVKVIMGVYRRGMAGIVIPKGSIQTPADLRGKSLAFTPGDGPSLMFPGFMRANNLPMEAVKMQAVDAAAKLRLGADRKVDGTITYVPASVVIMEGLSGVEFTGLLFSDSGVNVPSLSIVANTKTLESQPDMVRRFVAATAKGYADARKDPKGAAAIQAKYQPQIKGQEANFAKTFERTLDFFDTKNTVGKPFGWQSPDDWKAAAEILERYMEAKPGTAPTLYYTNEFVSQ
jgi:NitT/TauT family transport system substrate-binding protein